MKVLQLITYFDILPAMRTLSLITTCTNRKRIVPLRRLTARSLPKGSTNQLAREWTDRISRANPVVRAEDLYQGRAFSEARKLAEVAEAPLYVISAGLGLLRADKPIPSYSLTVSAGANDAIQGRYIGEAFAPTEWWATLTRRYGNRNPLTELIARSKRKLWLLALPSNYFELIASDLNQLGDAQLDRIRMVGPKVGEPVHRVLGACLLDIDDRLNGPDSPLPGTQADFAQRAARFVYDAVLRRNMTGDISAHRRAIARRLAGLRPARRFERQRMSDDAIISTIRALWEEADGGSSKLLRMLRDQEQIACEQGRFVTLFRQVQREVLR